MENKKETLNIFIVFIIIGLVLFGIYKVIYSTYDYNIYFLESIESDSIIIQSKNANILIDTAEEKDNNNLNFKLANLGITKIDYLIITHPDKDHIGNASFIINNYNVFNVIETSFEKGSDLQKDFKQNLAKQPNINHIVLEKDYDFEIDNMRFKIITPNEKSYKEDNDYSLVTYLNIGKINFMFTGDIEQTRINEQLEKENIDIDVYKIPHHGRYNNLSLDLIKEVTPEYAVSTGDTDSEITNFLNVNSIKYYNTEEGTIHFSTNGTKLKVLNKTLF